MIDPELRRSIVELEMVRSIDFADGGIVNVVVSLTTLRCPIRNHFEQAVTACVSQLDEVKQVNVGFDVLSDDEKQGLQAKLGPHTSTRRSARAGQERRLRRLR